VKREEDGDERHLAHLLTTVFRYALVSQQESGRVPMLYKNLIYALYAIIVDTTSMVKTVRGVTHELRYARPNRNSVLTYQNSQYIHRGSRSILSL
jgi:hypothetical protein